MSLYSVLLVDDEEEIRQGIIRKIDWQANGFCLVGDAENGEEALELAKRLQPDVVMTDIKMPYMDGLELCRILCERMPSTKLVVFSGFDDFEYAKQAIGVNVSEYILKPINAAEFSQVLQKLKHQIDAELEAKRDVEALRLYYNQSLPLLREQYFSRLVEGRIAPDQILEQAKLLGLYFNSPFYTALIFTHDKHQALLKPTELIPLSVKRIIEEHAAGALDINCFLLGDCVAGVVALQSKGEIPALMAAANRICKLIERFLELTVTVGIGSVCHGPQELCRSFLGALDAVEYRVIMGAGKAIFIEDVEPDLTVQLEFDEQDERELYSAIKLGTPDTVRETVARLLTRVADARLPMHQYQIFLLELQAALIKLARSSKIDIDEAFGRDFQKMYEWGNLNELEHWLCGCCVKLGELISLRRTDSAKIIAESAREFIFSNFQDSDLSIETICEHLHVSPAYFSTVFKRETKASFVNYLTSVRMEQAARLLQTTEDKTYLIAQAIGYNDPNYFSYVFKKHYGVSPSRYRGGK